MAILEVSTDSIDWVVLQEQKKSILDMIYDGGHNFSVGDLEALEGIVGLIDGLQDNAAEVLGDVAVFGESPDDDEYEDWKFTMGLL